jgi:hypothetical protein
MTGQTVRDDSAVTRREVDRAYVVEQVYGLDATTELKALIRRIQGEDPEARRRIVGVSEARRGNVGVSQAKRGTTGWSV